jgi:hypothetical protein
VDTIQLQNGVRSFLSAMEPEESIAFASLVYFYIGLHDIRYNRCILCAHVDAALVVLNYSLFTCLSQSTLLKLEPVCTT